MKRFLTFLLVICAISAVKAEEYTIVFNSGNSDSGSEAKNMYQIIQSATFHCVADAQMSKIYRAKDGYGIKGGTGTAGGHLTLRLDATYHVTSLTIYAAAFANKADTADAKGINVSGHTIHWQKGSKTLLQPYSVAFTGNTDSITIDALEDKNCRFYVQKIVFTAADPMPNHAKIDLPYVGFEFPSIPYDSTQAAEDAETFSVTAHSVNSDGLQLSMKSGKIFSISPSQLPADGGDFLISYSCNFLSYTFSDTVVISGVGADGQRVSQLYPVKGTVYKYVPKPIDSTGMVIGKLRCDYYDYADGKADAELKSALGAIVNCGARYRYGSGNNSTWQGFYYTDRDTITNQVLDMYSNNARYFNPERPTASVAEFDIEHMFPKSWWGGTVNAAYKDLFHLVPGDYSANRSKSNHAPGIVTDTTFWNGSFATGADEIHGISKVFTPADEYKGDFARAYFYIATCYGDSLTWVSKAGSEPAEAMDNDSYLEFRPWLYELLLDWHRLDPVSQKEIDRAVAVNQIQGNRNPFIDYPELVEYIWGNKQGSKADFSQLTATCEKENCTPTSVTMEPVRPQDVIKRLERGELIIVRDGKRYTVLGISK